MPNLNYHRPKLSAALELFPSFCNSPGAQDVMVRYTCLNYTRPVYRWFLTSMFVPAASLDHFTPFPMLQGDFDTHSLHSPIFFDARIAPTYSSAPPAPFPVRFPKSGQDPFRAGFGDQRWLPANNPLSPRILVDDSHRTTPAISARWILPRQWCISRKEGRSETGW